MSASAAPMPHGQQRLGIGATENLRVLLASDPPGLVESPAFERVLVCIHAGAPVVAECRHGREHHRGTVIFGDIDIIPPGTPAAWELKGKDVDLVISIKPELLRSVAMESGGDPRVLEVKSRFQIRDAQIEHIGWAIKAEMDNGYPCGRLYMDSLATALAARIVRRHSSLAGPSNGHNGKLSSRKLREVLTFIEEHLGRPISLAELAQIAGLSVSHFKVLFRASVGMSAHRYVIRRRVDRAAEMLRRGRLPIGQVALEAGFCHQSHLAMHMRRILGASPRALRQTAL